MIHTYRYMEESFSFDMYQFHEMMADIEMERTINEMLCISSGGSNKELQSIIEAEGDKKKGVFARLMDMISKFWAKFMEMVNGFVQSDKAYLEKYKDIILKRKLKEQKFLMHPFWEGTNEMLNSKVPAFNLEALRDSLESDETFLAKHFPSYYKEGQKEKYTDIAKARFRGNEKQIELDSNRINMTTLYNFCINYNSMVKKLENDMKQIENAANKAKTEISRIKPAATTSTGESAIYSSLYESYIVLEEEKESTGATVKKVEDPKAKAEEKAKDNSPSENPKDAMQNTSGDNSSKVDSTAETKNSDLDKIDRYIKLAYGFLSVKMAVIVETYKAYMYIIRDHVKSYVGDKSGEGKQDAEAGDKYTRDQADEINTNILGDTKSKGNTKSKGDEAIDNSHKSKGRALKDIINKQKQEKEEKRKAKSTKS